MGRYARGGTGSSAYWLGTRRVRAPITMLFGHSLNVGRRPGHCHCAAACNPGRPTTAWGGGSGGRLRPQNSGARHTSDYSKRWIYAYKMFSGSSNVTQAREIIVVKPVRSRGSVVNCSPEMLDDGCNTVSCWRFHCSFWTINIPLMSITPHKGIRRRCV